MNVALILTPSYNPDKPPLSLAYLKSYNQRDDINIKCFDLNIDLYSRVSDLNKKFWNSGNVSSWMDKEKLDSLDFIDDRIISLWTNEIMAFNPRIVGFSVYSTNLILALKISKKIKEASKDVFILFGGPGIFTYRSNSDACFLDPVDATILGEGEELLRKVIESVDNKGFIMPAPSILIRREKYFMEKEESTFLIENLDEIPFPDYDDFDLKKYKEPGQLPLLFSRGCVGKCAFCYETVFWRKFRSRRAETVIKEINHLLNKYDNRIFNFSFNDSLINGDIKVLETFCNIIIENKMNIGWWGMARIDTRMDRDFIKKMIEAGCKSLAYGIESGSQKVLDLMGKRYTLKDIEKSIVNTYEAGIKPGISLLVGFPGEDEEDFNMTCSLVKKLGKYLSYVNIAPLGIIPGTLVDRNKEKLGLHVEDSINWGTSDGKNTLEVRIDRVNILADIANEYVGKVSAFE